MAESILDYHNTNYAESVPLVEEFITGQPILNIVPAETNIIDHVAVFSRDEGLQGDSGRVVNNTTITAAEDDDFSIIKKELIIRDRKFFLDNKILNSTNGNNVKNLKLKKALQALGASANYRFINGTEAADDFRGLNVIAQDNSMTSSYGTAVSTAATAQTCLDYLEDAMSSILYRATHLLIGSDGFKVLRKIATYSQQVTVSVQDRVVGKAIGEIILGAKTLPIVWAGKVGYGSTTINNEVIPLSTTTTDFYLVDFSENGVTFALELAPTKAIEGETGISYVLEQYQMLCDKSAYCVYKHTQTV
jgi:hypothetical protein